MIKSPALFFLLLIGLSAQAQDVISGDESQALDPAKIVKPLGRVKSTTQKNSESSSFYPDPDQVDPLNPNNENLRDDDEPVLENIRQVIDTPLPKPEASQVDATKVDSPATANEAPVKKAVNKPKAKKVVKKTPPRPVLNPDDPDLKLEEKFNKIYRTYNKNPTAEDVWAAASSQQASQQYSVQKGDTLWSISKILFGDPNFWPKLWALNKQGILNPHFINPGTIIYFYSGDEQSSPTLSIGSQSNGAGLFTLRASRAGENSSKIPPSLPISRNEIYFTGNEREVDIQLGDIKQFERVYANDIFITDTVLKTKVNIQMAEVSKFRCYDGRLIKKIKYAGKLEPDYDVFERLEDVKGVGKPMPSYRYYGAAQPYAGKYLKLSNCRGLIASDLVLLPKDQIQQFRTQRISPGQSAKVIGGPEVISQKLFTLNQIIFVDFGVNQYETGQEYKVISQVTDEVNGRVKVIEKYGSYAVVVVDELNDVMEVGDKLILE